MFRKLGIAVAAISVLALTVSIVAAGNAHFVGTPTIQESGNTATASGKVAGLGNIPDITVDVSGLAECVNPGGKKPKADNKDEFSATATVPVQNGKANFSILLTATFKPDCTPPMTVDWSGLAITVTAEEDPSLFLQFP